MLIGSRLNLSCRRLATAAEAPGAGGSTLPSIRRTTLSNGRAHHLFLLKHLGLGRSLWRSFSRAWEISPLIRIGCSSNCELLCNSEACFQWISVPHVSIRSTTTVGTDEVLVTFS